MRLMAGDEHDVTTGGHQRQRETGQPALRIAVEAHGMPRVETDAGTAERGENQGVEPAEPATDVVDHRGRRCLVGDVGADRGRLAARGADGLSDAFGALGVGAVVDDGMGTGGSELLCYFGADAPRGSGYQGDPCGGVLLHIGFLPSLPMRPSIMTAMNVNRTPLIRKIRVT